MVKYLKWYLIIFGLIALAVYIFVPEPNKIIAVVSVGVAALISLVMLYKTLNEHYSGIIQTIKIETITTTNNHHRRISRDITYAYIKLDTGKTKKVPAMPEWKSGFRIEKIKGEATPKAFPVSSV